MPITLIRNGLEYSSLVSRPSQPPGFDCLQHAKHRGRRVLQTASNHNLEVRKAWDQGYSTLTKLKSPESFLNTLKLPKIAVGQVDRGIKPWKPLLISGYAPDIKLTLCNVLLCVQLHSPTSVTHVLHSQYNSPFFMVACSLVPRPLPDFISQLWILISLFKNTPTHSNQQLTALLKHCCAKLLSDCKEFDPEICSCTTSQYLLG